MHCLKQLSTLGGGRGDSNSCLFEWTAAGVLTNTPAFGQPNGVLGSSAFGTITSTATDPRVLQFGLKLNY